MRLSDDDITKMLAELPEIELPEGFHDEVMQKVKAEVGRPGPKPKKKSRTIWYIGSFATAAAAVAAVVIMLALPDFGRNQWNYGEFAATADAAPPPPGAAAVPEAVIARAPEPEEAMEIFDVEFALDLEFDLDLEPETPIARGGMGLYQRNLEDFTAGAGAATRGTEVPEMPIAQAEVPEEVMEIFEIEYAFEDDFDFDPGFAFSPEVGAPIALPDVQLWSQNLDDVWAQAVTVSVFHFPEHLPTEHLDFELSEYFAFTFEIFIVVEDIAYAREAISDMGGPDGQDDGIAYQMILQPAFEDLEDTFTALYALGIVEEYRVTATNTLVLSDMGRIYEAWREANTIFVTVSARE